MWRTVSRNVCGLGRARSAGLGGGGGVDVRLEGGLPRSFVTRGDGEGGGG